VDGKKLGNYDILDKLGEGGMGEVWRARDERLHRMVAIKMLPREVAEDPVRRARFEQEARARALAALNHPNILTIYDVGLDDGRAYMVSELVDGEPLRALLDRGPLGARKAIEIAVQMGEGVAAAHALGIVHRDLKPENVIVRPTGQVKLLDFGLAKQNVAPASEQTATMALSLSQPGMVMGTAGYMSPEQVRGEPADARSDIFSLGCVLHEMIAGRRAFQGATAVDTMHAILNSEPAELETGQAPMQRALAAIVRRCLEKRPEQRFQSAADLAFALRSIAGTNATGTAPAVASPRTSGQTKRWLWTLAAAVGGLLLFLGGFFLHGLLSPRVQARFQRITFRKGKVAAARFMPDGKSVVYEANWEGGPYRTYLAIPGSPDSRDLGIPADSRLLSVSTNGDLAFATYQPGAQSGTLVQSSISGGQTRPLLDGVMAADWAPDGASMAVLRWANGRARLEYPIGKVLVDHIDGPIETIRVSPDGQLVAYENYFNGRSVELNVVDRSGKRRPLGAVSGQTSSNAFSALVWTPKGDEIWFRSFDSSDPQTIEAMDLKGRKRVVANLPGRVDIFDLSRDGRLLMSTGSMQFGILGGPVDHPERDLSCLDTGIVTGISDDGRLIAASVFGESGGPKGSVYVRKTDGSPAVRLGDGSAYALSPDGMWASAFVPDSNGSRRFVLLPTGAGEEIVENISGLSDIAVVGWLEGTERYLVMGVSEEKERRCFAWDAARGSVQPVCPVGIGGPYVTFLSPDRKRVLTYGPGAGWFVYPVEGGPALQVHGIRDDEFPVGWRADNSSIFVRPRQASGGAVSVGIVEITSGKRSVWKELRLTRPVEAPGDLHLHITPDGKAYAYNYSVLQSDLYVAQGLGQ